MVAKSRHGVNAQHEAPVLERHTTRFRAGRQPGPLMAPRIGRDGCPGQVVVKEALFQHGDVCCTRQQTGDFCADPFLSIPALRQLSAGKGVGRSASSPWLATGEEGGKIRQQRLRARSTRGGKEQHRLRARSARGEKEKAMHRNCVKKRTEEETTS